MMYNDQESGPERRHFLIPWAILGLIAIIAVGAWLRFSGLDWDERAHLHPDERFLTMVETAIQPTFSISEYFSSSLSPLNPRNRGHEFFVYGTLPIFVVRYTAEIVDVVCASMPNCTQRFISYDEVHLLGRAISGLADLATVLVLFFIGRRLYNQWVGLIAAGLYAFAVLPIQNSHFFTVDTFLVLMISVSFYYAIRITQDGGWGDWVLFGLFFGGALACKVSVWPMGFVLVAAVVIRSSRPGEQNWMALYAGLAIAAVITFMSFRILQPYAFAGLNFDVESMGEERFNAAAFTAPPWWRTVYDVLPAGIRTVILPSPRWLANMETIRSQMTGDVDFPPNHQWTNRKPIIFPWINMVLYGMGPLLGVTAWIGWIAAIIQMAIRRFAWQRQTLPVLWVLIFFMYQGTQWVKSMRYLLPIYPILILLAGWFLYELIQKARANRTIPDGIKTPPVFWRTIQSWTAVALLALVLVATGLWAFSFAEIYRQPSTRVAATSWVYRNVPMGASLLYQVDGVGTGELLEAPIPLMKYDYGMDGQRNITSFVMPQDGAAVGIRFNYLSDPAYDSDEEVFHASLSADPTGNQQLASALLIEDLQPIHNERGDPHQLSWAPVLLKAGQQYYLTTEVLSGAPVRTTGAYLVNETSWDDGLPLRQDGLDGFSIYDGDPLELYWEDDLSKRERMIELLDKAEYLFITSSRQLGSIPRIVPRYPLTIAYYEALFNEELGFEPVATFLGDIHIGPLWINDVFGKLGWGEAPQVGWPPPGELAAEEAFSVYDHPPVWIFKKTADYSSRQTRAILESVDLSQRRVVIPYDYTKELRSAARPDWLEKLLNGGEKEPVELEQSASMWLSPDDQAQQQAGGTWSEIVNADGLLSQKPVIGAAVWWITVILLGWLVWPLVSVVLGGLPSKGYVVCKVFALLFIAWVTWMATSLKLVTYDRRTIWLAIAVMAFFSAIAAYLRRRHLRRFIQDHWRFMLVAEMVGIALFAISLLIRSGNPDLWHPSFGGEKPMDFAFLNAVIKSAAFPPYDPWLSGAYINYYYFGFILLGNLIKLLRIVPYVAYNIALPMLFSLTGLGAFSLAFDLVAGDLFKRQPKSDDKVSKTNRFKPAIKAGLLAAVIVVLLGNLGQAWTLVGGWNKLGRLNTGPETG
ncbi:MAG: glycosyltransferase family 39 protein, partial [Anaerolineales bacterium]|nr:glycosyltransferase family 39 protein [Anaerolineales bacterium]